MDDAATPLRSFVGTFPFSLAGGALAAS